MKFDLNKILLSSELFERFSEEEFNEFLLNNHYKIESYKKNDILALAGDRCNDLLIVLDGCLITRMVSGSGKSIQIDKIDTGRVVAPAMLFASDNVFPVNVHPEDEVDIFVMSKNVFLEALQKSEKLLFNFIRIISNINRFLSNKIHFLSLKSIRGKIADYLLSQLEMQDSDTMVKLSQTRQELADRFGVSRQSLIRSLSELENEGIIKLEGRRIIVLSKNKLALED